MAESRTRTTVCGLPATWTFTLCCLVAVVDRADQMLLPAVYLEVARTLRCGPAFLGTISLCRGVAQAATSLVSGPLGRRHNRVHLTACGCAVWGVATAWVGLSTSAPSLMAARTLNGVGLGFATPLVLSLVADLAPRHQGGAAYGALGTCSNLGAAAGAATATLMASSGPEGWRGAFYVVAAASVLLGVLIAATGVDPQHRATHRGRVKRGGPLADADDHGGHDGHADGHAGEGGTRRTSLPRNRVGSPAADAMGQVAGGPSPVPLEMPSWWALAGEVSAVLALRSVWVLALQGVLFAAPWYALNYLTLWLEVRGGSHAGAARTRACFDVGVTVGVVAGGAASDAAAAWCAAVSAGDAGADPRACSGGSAREDGKLSQDGEPDCGATAASSLASRDGPVVTPAERHEPRSEARREALVGAGSGTFVRRLLGRALRRALGPELGWHSGRILVAQGSLGLGVPLFLAALLAPPTSAAGLEALLLVAGLVTQAEFPSKASLLCGLAPLGASATAFATVGALEGVLAAATAPLTGLLAEAYGLHAAALRSQSGGNGSGGDGGGGDGGGSDGSGERNGEALGRAMGWAVAAPWALCVLALAALHTTYPADHRAATAQAAVLGALDSGKGDGAAAAADVRMRAGERLRYNPVLDGVLEDRGAIELT